MYSSMQLSRRTGRQADRQKGSRNTRRWYTVRGGGREKDRGKEKKRVVHAGRAAAAAAGTSLCLIYSWLYTVPVFVNLLRSPGIDRFRA
jgi:hypothetical protein